MNANDQKHLLGLLHGYYRLFAVEHPERELHAFGELGVSASRLAHPMANLAFTRTPEKPVRRQDLEAVIAFFRGRQSCFCFSAIGDMVSRNETLFAELGLEVLAVTKDVAFDLATQELPAAPALDVAECPPHIDEAMTTLADGFRLPRELFLYLDAVLYRHPALGTKIFLLRGDDGKPRAAATITPFFERRDAVVFNGAATLKEFRGQGSYRALLRRRLEVAKASGFRWAVIQANEKTSAPIALATGFRPVTESRLYFWNYRA